MQKVQDRLSDQEKEDLIAGHYKSILELLGLIRLALIRKP